MKTFILFSLAFLPLGLFGQKCDTLNGQLINCFDINSLKQGYWYEYSVTKILTNDSFRRNPKAIGFHNDKGLVYTPISEGFYKNDRKVGTWVYYVGFYNDPSAHTKKVYFTDSGYHYEIDSFYHSNFKIADDTSALTGKLFLKSETIDITCQNQNCQLYNPFLKKRQRFSLKKLDEYIRYLNFYSFKVVKKKNAS